MLMYDDAFRKTAASQNRAFAELIFLYSREESSSFNHTHSDIEKEQDRTKIFILAPFPRKSKPFLELATSRKRLRLLSKERHYTLDGNSVL